MIDGYPGLVEIYGSREDIEAGFDALLRAYHHRQVRFRAFAEDWAYPALEGEGCVASGLSGTSVDGMEEGLPEGVQHLEVELVVACRSFTFVGSGAESYGALFPRLRELRGEPVILETVGLDGPWREAHSQGTVSFARYNDVDLVRGRRRTSLGTYFEKARGWLGDRMATRLVYPMGWEASGLRSSVASTYA